MFGIEEDAKISPNLTDHFTLYFPDEKTIFPSQNLPMERALNGQATDDQVLFFMIQFQVKKKRVLISGKLLLDQGNNVIAAVVKLRGISKYKKLEQELKAIKTKYGQLIGFKKTEHDDEDVNEDLKEEEGSKEDVDPREEVQFN